MIFLSTWKLWSKRELEMNRTLGLWKKITFKRQFMSCSSCSDRGSVPTPFLFIIFFQTQEAYTKQAVENIRRDFRTKMSSGYMGRVLVFSKEKEQF